MSFININFTNTKLNKYLYIIKTSLAFSFFELVTYLPFLFLQRRKYKQNYRLQVTHVFEIENVKIQIHNLFDHVKGVKM